MYITLGKKTLRELRQLYFRLKDDVFGKGRFGMAYNTNKLEEILKHEFGDMKMSDVNYPRWGKHKASLLYYIYIHNL